MSKRAYKKMWRPAERNRNYKVCKNCACEINKKSYRKHREQRLEGGKRWRENNPLLVKGLEQRRILRNKTKVISHYSNGTMACANPFGGHKEPYTTLAALTIDHPNNNGAEERKRLFGSNNAGGQYFYRWLIKNNYPERYQILCFNCQWIKRMSR